MENNKTDKTDFCDACGKKIILKESWFTFWVKIAKNEKKETSKEMTGAWLTCHPSGCNPAKQLQATPVGIQLLDHYSTIIAGDAEHWALDYNAKPELIVKMLIRLAPLIKYPRPQ